MSEQLKELDKLRVVNPAPGRLASPMVTGMLPDNVDRTAFAKMLLQKHELSIRATHKEFGMNSIRFCTHVFNTEKEVDYAVDVVSKELN